MSCTLLRTNRGYNFFKFKNHVCTAYVRSFFPHQSFPILASFCKVLWKTLSFFPQHSALWGIFILSSYSFISEVRFCVDVLCCVKKRLESFSEKFPIDATFKDSPPFLFLTCRPFKPPLLEEEEGSASWYDREWKLWSTTLR